MAICLKLPRFISAFTFTALALGFSHAQASGMSPGRTAVFIDEAVGETTVNVKNTDPIAALLVTNIYNPEGDLDNIVSVTPPMARVEPGEIQAVRFILDVQAPLKVQQLRRVTFEGVQPNSKPGSSKVGITLMQDLPVIISPSNLKKDPTPWTHLKWSSAQGQLTVSNPSPYVVRLVSSVEVLPGNRNITLPKTYILPGQTLNLALPKDSGAPVTRVTFKPADLHGDANQAYSVPIE